MGLEPPIFDAPASRRPSVRTVPQVGSDAEVVTEVAPVRHLPGYEVFAGYVRSQDASPAVLSRDIEALLDFIHVHGDQLGAADSLGAAAQIFLGNALVQLRADARWVCTEPGQMLVGGPHRLFDPRVMLLMIRDGPASDAPRGARMIHDWSVEMMAERDALDPVPRHSDALATAYRPPACGSGSYRDARGRIIDYGNRWNGKDAPEESYERVSHPERFAPLSSVVQALVEYCRREFDVEVSAVGEADGVTTHLVPADPLAAPLRLELSHDDRGTWVKVFAGVLHGFVYPSCACDACDETVQGAGEELAETVLGVAAGGFAERVYRVGGEAWIEYRLNSMDGESSLAGEGPAETTAAVLERASDILAQVPTGWHLWPLRSVQGDSPS